MNEVEYNNLRKKIFQIIANNTGLKIGDIKPKVSIPQKIYEKKMREKTDAYLKNQHADCKINPEELKNSK